MSSPKLGEQRIAGTMTAVLDLLLCVVLLWIACQLYKFARLWYAFKDVPKIHETFPCSGPLDLILEMRALKKRSRRVDRKTTSLPKSKIYARWLFKTMDYLLPDYYEKPILCSVVGPVAFVMAINPESTEAILSSTSNVNKRFSHHFLKPWLGNGLLSNPGDATWKSHRKMLTPTMHFRILDEYLQTMNDNALRFVGTLHESQNSIIDIYPMIRMCTFSILFETAFGIRLDENDPEHSNFLTDCDELADLILARIVNIPHWYDFIFKFTEGGRQMKAASDRISSYIYKIIDMKLVALENNNEIGKSFIDIVMKMHREGLLSRQDVRDHVATFIVGGFDTTATTMAYTLHLLANHPEVQQKLFEEVESVLADSEEITKEQLKMLTYTEAVCKESMRLFPPLPLISRNLTTPVRVGKHLIPAGTVGLVDIYHLHRNPHVWEEPADFRPARFVDSKNRHPYSFVPFSAGPRNCIGQKFASQEDKILLAQIVRAFKLHTDQSSEQLRLSFDLILRPLAGIEIRLEPRTSNPLSTNQEL